AQRDPDLQQRLCRSAVLELLRTLSANADQGALDGAYDVGEADLLRRSRQPVAALGSALAAHDPSRAQLRQNVLEERDRNRLSLRDRVDLARRLLATIGQLDDGAHGVVGLCGDVHARILTYSTADGRGASQFRPVW